MDEDWAVLRSFLPAGWEELGRSSGALKGLRKDKSAETALRGRIAVRVNTGALPLWTPEGARFDLLAALSGLRRAGAVGCWPAAAGGVRGRVCAVRKSAQAARSARKRARREAKRQGSEVKPATLAFADYVIVFTTFCEQSFGAGEVLEWYRLRWQVELVFKRLKSLARLGHLPKHDDDSARAWLYGKLLVALLVDKLVDHARAVSPWGYQLAAAQAA